MGKVSYFHILLPTSLYFAVLFGCYPLQIQVIVQALCRIADDDDGECDSSHISSQASLISVYSSIATYAPTILLAGTYGSIANRLGRKFVLYIAFAGVLFSVASSLYIVIVKPSNIIPPVVAGSLLYGLCGGYSTFIMAVFSYTSDATADDPLKRKLSYPITEGAIFIPKLIAPIMGGIAASYWGFSYPLITGIALTLLGFLWVMVIPESLPEHSPCRQEPLALSPLQTFHNIAFIFQHKTKTGAISAVPFIAVAFCMYYIAYVGSAPVIILYAKHTFNWGPALIGYFDGIGGGIHAFSMLCVPVIVHFVTNRNFKLLSWIQIGYFLKAVYWTALGVAPSSNLFFAALSLELPCGTVAPYTRTILSNSVAENHQAQIFAAFAAIESIATLIAPVYTLIYGVTVKSGVPSLAFFVMALSAVVSGGITTYVRFSPRLKSSLPDQSKLSEHRSEYKSLIVSSESNGADGSHEVFDGSFVLDDEVALMYDYDTLRRLDYPAP